MLAFITWRLNRFGTKDNNNKISNKEYFDKHNKEILEIINFLEDKKSKTIYQMCLRYRETH